MKSVKSKNGIPIRLTMERWFHITEEHSEMAGYFYEILEAVSDPTTVFQGSFNELIAARETEPGKFLVVVYKETDETDGFVITAFFTRRIKQLERRVKLWP